MFIAIVLAIVLVVLALYFLLALVLSVIPVPRFLSQLLGLRDTRTVNLEKNKKMRKEVHTVQPIALPFRLPKSKTCVAILDSLIPDWKKKFKFKETAKNTEVTVSHESPQEIVWQQTEAEKNVEPAEPKPLKLPSSIRMLDEAETRKLLLEALQRNPSDPTEAFNTFILEKFPADQKIYFRKQIGGMHSEVVKDRQRTWFVIIPHHDGREIRYRFQTPKGNLLEWEVC